MTLDRLTEIVEEYIKDRLDERDSCKVCFEINVAKGGIGNCKVRTERLIQDN